MPPGKIANWLSGDFFGLLNLAGIDFKDNVIPPVDLARLVEMVQTGDVNATSAKTVLAEMFSGGGTPDHIVNSLGMVKLSDAYTIREIVDDVLTKNPKQVKAYLAGKSSIVQWLFGQVMRSTGGMADPGLVQEQLDQALNASAGKDQSK